MRVSATSPDRLAWACTGPGGETTFYPAGTILLDGWQGHQEMPIDTAVDNSNWATVNYG